MGATDEQFAIGHVFVEFHFPPLRPHIDVVPVYVSDGTLQWKLAIHS